VTKQFTAVAIMTLVEEGKLSLRDDVRKFVPGYPTKGAIITIEHLLTHTSGVPSYTDQPAFGALMAKDLTHAELLALFKDRPLEFTPGTRWKYSNSGYYLLGPGDRARVGPELRRLRRQAHLRAPADGPQRVRGRPAHRRPGAWL
jgi:CubicO group peptidase (beta-lactamase class C family)